MPESHVVGPLLAVLSLPLLPELFGLLEVVALLLVKLGPEEQLRLAFLLLILHGPAVGEQVEVAVLLEQLVLHDLLLGGVQLIELLHEVLPLHLVELLPADLDFLERGERLAQFGAARERVVAGLLELLRGAGGTVLSS